MYRNSAMATIKVIPVIKAKNGTMPKNRIWQTATKTRLHYPNAATTDGGAV